MRSKFRVGRRWLLPRIGLASLPARFLKERSQRDHIQQIGFEALQGSESVIDCARLIAVTSEESGLQWPAQEFFRDERQKKCADKLPIGKPDAGIRITALERQYVYQNGPRALEEDVQRGCVLQCPTGVDGLVRKAQSELGCGAPLPGCPLPRIRNGIDARMFEPKLSGQCRQIRVRLDNLGWDQIAAALQRLAQGRRKKGTGLFDRRGIDAAEGMSWREMELARRIAESRLQRNPFTWAVKVG